MRDRAQPEPSKRTDRHGAATAGAIAVLALLAYVPALLSSPDRLPADTKLYLYLDPGRLISDAPWTFDARQFAGWVPHQVIAYLWPQGPWFWLGDTVGLPDWVVHRLWIGTLFVAAGTGVLWLGRRLGLGLLAALAAAVVYQLSPYILPYVSRTSAMLLPWAGLGWIVGLTAAAATRTPWRHAALAALVVATVGAVNATALMMIAPAPVLWLLSAAIGRLVTWRRALTTALRIGVLSLGVSLWWIAAVSIQGRLGAPVLSYSETLGSVSLTSTSTEVWRNLGYWLTYVRDAWYATTTAGLDYMASGRLVAAGFLLLLIGVTGLVVTRWAHRRFAVLLVAVGVVLGVGVHPIDDPSPLMRLLRGDGESGAALALRSSTRAVPMLVLGLALGAGALVDASASVRVRWQVPWRPLLAAAVAVLAILNLPSLTGHRLVDPAIDHDQDPPAAWRQAAAALDAGDTGARVLQLPGQEFGAFRWGYTVDPPLPGMTDKPLVTRDLLPLGSAPAMDLLYALDDRFQTGTVEPAEIAPVARLLGADTIWVTGDAAFERFGTPRPEIVADMFADGVPGTGQPTAYGTPVPNVPDAPAVDEQSVSDPRVAQPVAPVELVPITDPTPVVRAKDRVVLVAGSGDGLVDAAGAGLIDGDELVRYTGSLHGGDLAAAAASASEIIVTDSNRDRAHAWRGSQDVTGFTESGDATTSDLLRRDPADQRLPVFGDAGAPQTVAVQLGPVHARASAYGEPFAYRPEDRAFMAIDGDPATAWRVADRGDPIGEQLQLDVAKPIDHVTLTQAPGAATVRHIGRVTVAVSGRAPFDVGLGDESLGAGQRIAIPATTGASTITITIDSVVVPDPSLGPALAAVGFAEADTGLGPTVEVVRPPADARTAVAAAGSRPVSYVFSRLRTRPTDRWRSDPEPELVREIELPARRTFQPQITARLDQRSTDAVLARLLGVTGPQADRRLLGAATAAGWALADGDPATAWQTPFSAAVGSTVTVTATNPVSSFTIRQAGGDHSPITSIDLASGGAAVEAAVPQPDASGVSTVTLAQSLPAGPVRLTITAVDPKVVLDRRYGEPVTLPAAIAELSAAASASVPATLDTGCRDDLVTIDGHPLPVRVQGSVRSLLAGDPVAAVPCGGATIDLAAGTHRLATAKGLDTGLDIDRVVLAAPDRPAIGPSATGPRATVTSRSRLSRDITVEHCPEGCWLVLGEGFADSWSASTAAGSLGKPQLVDGGFNGWWIPPSSGPVAVSVHWTAQTPQTIALVLSAMAVLACLALVLLDRRRAAVPVTAAPRFAAGERPIPRRRRWIAAGTWVLAAVLLVGPGWGLVAAVTAAVIVVVLGRPRLAGAVTFGILAVMGLVVVWIMRREHPYPSAGWPLRFERLHGLGLFAAVSLGISLFSGSRSAPCEPAAGDAG
jgi:arabinofuranan 3-O-arabinosyltransferase